MPKTKKDSSLNEKRYEDSHPIEKLKLFVIIVNRKQSDYFVNEFKNKEIACSFVVYGRGTASKEIYEVLGIGETKKDILFVIVKESDVETLKEIIDYRFKGAKSAKGIAFSIPFNSIAGVLAYRFLTNRQSNLGKEGVSKNGK